MFGLFRYFKERKERRALKERLEREADQVKERLRLERLRLRDTPLSSVPPPRRGADEPRPFTRATIVSANDDYPYMASHHRMKKPNNPND